MGVNPTVAGMDAILVSGDILPLAKECEHRACYRRYICRQTDKHVDLEGGKFPNVENSLVSWLLLRLRYFNFVFVSVGGIEPEGTTTECTVSVRRLVSDEQVQHSSRSRRYSGRY